MSNASNHTISDGKVVTLHYTLTNEFGEVIDKSEADDPLIYLHGAGNIVPGLEAALNGKAVGTELQATIAPEDGYGPRTESDPQPVPRDAFPEDVQIEAGMQFAIEDEAGDLIPVWVRAVEDDVVFLDENHPLAGETLHFDVKVVEIRDATKDEVEHGHPHGPDGHDHHH